MASSTSSSSSATEKRGTKRSRSVPTDGGYDRAVRPWKRQYHAPGRLFDLLGRDASVDLLFTCAGLLFGEYNPRGVLMLGRVCKAWKAIVDDKSDRWWWQAARAFWRRRSTLPFEHDHITAWIDSQWREFSQIRSWRTQLKAMYLSCSRELVWYDLADGHAFVPTLEWHARDPKYYPSDISSSSSSSSSSSCIRNTWHPPLVQHSKFDIDDMEMDVASFSIVGVGEEDGLPSWYTRYPAPVHHVQTNLAQEATVDEHCVNQLLVRYQLRQYGGLTHTGKDRSLLLLPSTNPSRLAYERLIRVARSHLMWLTRVKAGAQFCLHWTIGDLNLAFSDDAIPLHIFLEQHHHVGGGTCTPVHMHHPSSSSSSSSSSMGCDFRASLYRQWSSESALEVPDMYNGWLQLTVYPGGRFYQCAFETAFRSRIVLLGTMERAYLRSPVVTTQDVVVVKSKTTEDFLLSHDLLEFVVNKCGYASDMPPQMAMCTWSKHGCGWESNATKNRNALFSLKELQNAFSPEKVESKHIVGCGRWMGPGIALHAPRHRKCNHWIGEQNFVCPDCANLAIIYNPDLCQACRTFGPPLPPPPLAQPNNRV